MRNQKFLKHGFGCSLFYFSQKFLYGDFRFLRASKFFQLFMFFYPSTIFFPMGHVFVTFVSWEVCQCFHVFIWYMHLFSSECTELWGANLIWLKIAVQEWPWFAQPHCLSFSHFDLVDTFGVYFPFSQWKPLLEMVHYHYQLMNPFICCLPVGRQLDCLN